MVNVLEADNSEDVQQAFQEAAMGTGSYMVKQSSKSSVLDWPPNPGLDISGIYGFG